MEIHILKIIQTTEQNGITSQCILAIFFDVKNESHVATMKLKQTSLLITGRVIVDNELMYKIIIYYLYINNITH